MTGNAEFDGIDVPFAVPFVHRLRFTHDVFGRQQDVLAGVLEAAEDQPARIQVWIDENVAAAHPDLRQRIRAFAAGSAGRIVTAGNIQIVPGGEPIKNDIHIFERMLKCFNAADLDRWSYVVVIGGGAVLDAVSFAASIAHRGIRVVRLPTTTLSQCDSGVGVKNGVNLFHKKNWLGTFDVPWAVINDATLLSTVSDRDFVCGFAEAVKVSLLKDPALFEQVCRTAGRIRRRDMPAADPVLRTTARLHLDHITRGGDPFEMTEARPLDFGHWSAHKLEILSDFQLRHGEAVAVGLAIDAAYSSLVLGLPQEDAARIIRCLRDLGFVLDHPALADTRALFAGLEEFRQHLGGRLTLTMLRGIGDPVNIHQVDRRQMQQAIARISRVASET